MVLGYRRRLRVTPPLCVIYTRVLNGRGRGVRSGGHPIPAPAAPLVTAVGVLGRERLRPRGSQRLSQGIGAEPRAYDCAVVEVAGFYPMCGGHVLD